MKFTHGFAPHIWLFQLFEGDSDAYKTFYAKYVRKYLGSDP